MSGDLPFDTNAAPLGLGDMPEPLALTGTGPLDAPAPNIEDAPAPTFRDPFADMTGAWADAAMPDEAVAAALAAPAPAVATQQPPAIRRRVSAPTSPTPPAAPAPAPAAEEAPTDVTLTFKAPFATTDKAFALRFRTTDKRVSPPLINDQIIWFPMACAIVTERPDGTFEAIIEARFARAKGIDKAWRVCQS